VQNGGDGGNSIFGSSTAYGGGGGGGLNAKAGRAGGSSGGSAQDSTDSPGTASQGYAGGAGKSTAACTSASGGGGAGSVGLQGFTKCSPQQDPWGGDGGAGITSSITGTTVGYAGGGGGGPNNNCCSTATRGYGGGGASNIYGAGDGANADQGVGGDARANSGSGGGGGDYEGSGGLGGTGVVIIRYTPDQTAPTITGPSSATGANSSISIQENSTSVYTFSASETITWSISGTDASFFAVNSSGVLTITARDFETRADANADNIYIVIIAATDLASNATNQTLSVTITNVNEAPVIGAFSSASTGSYSVAENISSLFSLNATDVDAGTTLTYSLTGTDAADFAISGSGVLSLSPAADFENPQDSD
jgi:hypothetical protein